RGLSEKAQNGRFRGADFLLTAIQVEGRDRFVHVGPCQSLLQDRALGPPGRLPLSTGPVNPRRAERFALGGRGEAKHRTASSRAGRWEERRMGRSAGGLWPPSPLPSGGLLPNDSLALVSSPLSSDFLLR